MYRSETSVRSRYEERYIMPQFVVSVNTAHPNIRRQLDKGFDTAEKLVREGAAFAFEVSCSFCCGWLRSLINIWTSPSSVPPNPSRCIHISKMYFNWFDKHRRHSSFFVFQFNFNPMILHWWKQQGARRYDTLECLEITVATGASLVVTNYGPLNHCFDCRFVWCACWPCYCLSAVPYKIWRNIIQRVHDVNLNIEGSVTTAHPSSPGYNLSELHQAAILDNQPGMVPSAPPMPYGISAQPCTQPLENVLTRMRQM